MADDIKVIKNERGIGTGQTRDGTTPVPQADGSLPSTSNARNPIVSDPAGKTSAPRDPAGKTPGSAESGALDPAQGSGPGKTPGKSEG
ncbi:MAG TPA: hypothetical protein VFP52_12435 [Myxococcales bacterium]|nr:hypothetical protein [Myxococcales bacterium]